MKLAPTGPALRLQLASLRALSAAGAGAFICNHLVVYCEVDGERLEPPTEIDMTKLDQLGYR